MGTIRAICISSEKGTVKTPVEQARFIENYGIEGDAHAGNWHRQVSLLSYESVREFEGRLRQSALSCPKETEKPECDQKPESGFLKEFFENKEIPENRKIPVIAPGSFGENLLVEGLDLTDISCGTILRADDIVLRITQRGKECHNGCRIRELTGDCIMPREGVFAEVIKGGILKPGEEIFMENPENTAYYRAAVVTLSDKASRGEREDKSGPLLAKLLKDQGFEVIEELILPDEAGELKKNLIRLADRRDADLIITTGGTGFAPRDITPEATMAVATKNVPGIAEAIRAGSMKYTPKAMLSRAVSVIRNRTLIINFPGSPKAVEESFELIKEVLPHGLGILTGREGECARNGEKN